MLPKKRTTVGVVMGFAVSDGFAVGFYPTDETGHGKFKVTQAMKDAFDRGHRIVTVVRANPRNLLEGFDLHLVEGLPSDIEAETKAASELLMGQELEEWKKLARLRASPSATTKGK